MSDRHFPVHPNLEQLRHQAKDLLAEVRSGAQTAVAEFRKHHPKSVEPSSARLVDAQMALARSYGIPSWPRLVLACQMVDAIRRGDTSGVRALIVKHPKLLEEDARGVKGNWGPPMSYAANIGQDGVITMLREMGASDVQFAFDRACLQGKLDTARLLFDMGARPEPGSVMGPCETFSDTGLAFLLELGADISDNKGNRLAPVGMLLEGYYRKPEGKHRCLEIVATHGIDLPDTPVMAMHRGRIDLLEAHLQRDPGLLSRTFSHREIYPLELGCSIDESYALHGTPIAGTTLLHLCVDFDEIEIARWLVERGADVNAKAAIDADGFGGHTALFGCVVSQTYRCGGQKDAAFTRFLLENSADPNARASLRKRLRFVEDEALHEYRDVTPLTWGERFHDQDWVNREAMRLIGAA